MQQKDAIDSFRVYWIKGASREEVSKVEEVDGLIKKLAAHITKTLEGNRGTADREMIVEETKALAELITARTKTE